MTVRPQTTTWYLEGLCCSEEEDLIRKKLARERGIFDVRCSVVSRTVTVSHTCEEQLLTRALRDIGFSPRLQLAHDEPVSWWNRHNRVVSTGVSAALLVAGMLVGALVPESLL